MEAKKKKRITLSVVIATYNEESNLTRCLRSVQEIADEIVIVDGGSKDRTVDIAEEYHARVIQTTNPPIFHINKQKALDAAHGAWILQLDADEEVSDELAVEIAQIVKQTDAEIRDRSIDATKRTLFDRHMRLIEKRDGTVGTKDGDTAAFFVPRRNNFLGAYLRYAGTYPDGVIRLVRNGKAHFPCKSVHEQIVVEGRVAWLSHDLIHHSNPTLGVYMNGADKYTSLQAREMKKDGSAIGIAGFFTYVLIKPIVAFVTLYIRHKGLLDGVRGFLFSFFSSLHFPVAYFKYVRQ